MNYISTVTSKGTITLPAALRAQLGIREGDKVEISLEGNRIITTPKLGWDEFFVQMHEFGAKARAQIAAGEATSLLTNDDITAAAEKGRGRGY